jgi:hypothetical protein
MIECVNAVTIEEAREIRERQDIDQESAQIRRQDVQERRHIGRLSQSPFWNTDFSSLLRAFFTDLYCGRWLAVV